MSLSSTTPAPPPLIPPSFYFRPMLSCPRVEDIPRVGKGRLLNLPDSGRIPAFVELDGRSPWAEVRVGWNLEGLAVAIEVSDKPGRIVSDLDRPEESDGVQIWIDTRDTRDIHRASRHCHRFIATVGPASGKGNGKKGLDVSVRQAKIARATADAPMADLEPVRSSADRTRSGYRLELFLPSAVLHGFDPETSPRLGFSYRVTDPDRGHQHLSVGREFPVGEDPSLWATLELRDDD